MMCLFTKKYRASWYRLLGKSLIAGITVAMFIGLTDFFSELLWSVVPEALHVAHDGYVFILCLIGGIILGFFQRFGAGYPRTMAQLASTPNLEKTYRSDLPRTFIMAFIVLVFGAVSGQKPR